MEWSRPESSNRNHWNKLRKKKVPCLVFRFWICTEEMRHHLSFQAPLRDKSTEQEHLEKKIMKDNTTPFRCLIVKELGTHNIYVTTISEIFVFIVLSPIIILQTKMEIVNPFLLIFCFAFLLSLKWSTMSYFLSI